MLVDAQFALYFTRSCKKSDPPLTNLKKRGNNPRAPSAAGGYPNGGGHIIQVFKGTAMGNQLVR